MSLAADGVGAAVQDIGVESRAREIDGRWKCRQRLTRGVLTTRTRDAAFVIRRNHGDVRVTIAMRG